MDREVLMLHLRQAFGGTAAERRTVARAAGTSWTRENWRVTSTWS